MDILNNLDKIFSQNNKDIVGFIKGYANYLIEIINRIDAESIATVIIELEKARVNGNTIFLIGNGGSASTASHTANDFGLVVLKKSKDLKSKSYRAIALTDNMAVISAIGNDSNYTNIFLDQLKVNYRPGDKLIAISASGNSPNLVVAAEWFKEQGGTVIGWLGFDGGKIKDIANFSIIVNTPKGEYGPVEDIHLIIDHIIVTWMQYHIMNEEGIQLK